jgi:hypothetical protein
MPALVRDMKARREPGTAGLSRKGRNIAVGPDGIHVRPVSPEYALPGRPSPLSPGHRQSAPLIAIGTKGMANVGDDEFDHGKSGH